MAAEDKFRWRIRTERLSQYARSEIRLPSFSFKGHQWKIRIEKKGGLDSDCMSLHPVLELADPNPAPGGASSFVTDFRFTIVSRLHPSRPLETTFIVHFNGLKRRWDGSEIWVDLERRLKYGVGLLTDDALIFEARFCENLHARVYSDLLVLRTAVNEESGVRSAANYILLDTTLQGLSKTMPRTKKDLLNEYGLGTTKVSKYGDRILQTIASAVYEYNRKEGSGIRGNGMAAEDKFIWKIENFSTVTEPEIHSPTFSLEGHQWKIRLLRNGYMGYMSAYLEFDDSKTVSSLVADCRLTIVNQLKNPRHPTQITFMLDYNERSRSWDFINWGWDRDELPVEDTLIFEAQISKNLTARVYSDLLVLRTVLNEESALSTAGHYKLGDATLEKISRQMPRTMEELLKVDGMGTKRVSKYGDRILQTIASAIEDYNRDEGNGSRIEPLEAINDSTEKQEPEVIEFDPHDQFGRGSASPPLPSKVARTSTRTSPSNARSASDNLIAKLLTKASSSSWKSTSALLQEQRHKLAEFLEMSLESICQANRFDNVREVVLKISNLATAPTEKRVLNDLLPRLVEFSSSTVESLSIIETSSAEQLEESLLQRRNRLKLLDWEVSRNEDDQLKVDAEIQQLLARKDKLVRERNSALAEIEAANREASKELAEHEQARDNRLRAKERLAENNACWKLFKENLGL